MTLVIIATALLGTAGLQAYAMRMGKSSQFRTQAVFLASDIAERMEANKAATVTGSYQVPDSSSAPTLTSACSAAACDQTALAADDLSQWQNAIATTLPQSSWRIYLSTDRCATSTTSVSNPITYCIYIKWVDRSSNTRGTAGTGETFSYTSTRTVFQ